MSAQKIRAQKDAGILAQKTPAEGCKRERGGSDADQDRMHGSMPDPNV